MYTYIYIYIYITLLLTRSASSFGRVHHVGCSAGPLSDVHITQNVTAHAVGAGGFDQAFGDHLGGMPNGGERDSPNHVSRGMGWYV